MFVSVTGRSVGSTFIVTSGQNTAVVSTDMISGTVIDLTHDTPSQRSTRSRSSSIATTQRRCDMSNRRTRRTSLRRQNNIMDESVVIIDVNRGRSRRRRNLRRRENRNVSPSDIIDLEESTSEESDNGDNIPRCIQDSTNEQSNQSPVLLTCPICLEALSSSRKPTSTPCGHIYCAKCLKIAFRRSEKCPVCKTPARRKDFIRLHF